MRRRTTGVIVGLSAAALALGTMSTPAGATQRIDRGTAEPSLGPATHRGDNLPNPLAEKRNALRMTALNKLIAGTAKLQPRAGSSVVEVSPGQYVEWKAQREESIFTILVQFGNKKDSRAGGTNGPMHNKIAKPDRHWDGGSTDDNSTYWIKDFNVKHFRNLMFGDGESFRDFYLHQSQGRFLAKGAVSDWVKVKYNEARYGSNDIPESDGYWNFIKDSGNSWYAAQVKAGKTKAEIRKYLQQFDKWDRYDYDGDGNFNEPDGYIDHFQDIHAGEGEEAGGGAQGTDAIWSHRWYAFQNLVGQAGPKGNLNGGTEIGDSGMWIGDYTTEPENGGLGVFSHEFGHDLGLPDLYDTAGGDNGTGFWTLMSAGSWMNRGGNAIGTTPGYMGAWSKLFLGWLNYKVAVYGHDRDVTVGPAAGTSGKPQALLVTLPDKVTTTDYNTPYSGAAEWWGGSADNLNTTLTRTVDLRKAKKSATLTTQAWYNIESGYDFLYAEVSTDKGKTWTQIGDAVSGQSDWTKLSYDLSDYAGKKVEFRFRYQTDGGVHLAGPFLDDIALSIDGKKSWSDDVESGAGDWSARGFKIIDGTVTTQSANYYLAENRTYADYDETLKLGPYNFGWGDTRPLWVERFPYQNGLLVWYVDESYDDNNTSSHPGHGLVLPVDARPKPIVFDDGALLGNRRQPFDATFGLERTDKVTFHRLGNPVTVPSQKAMPLFDDANPGRYYSDKNPQGSVMVAGSGTSIRVLKADDLGNIMKLRVSFE